MVTPAPSVVPSAAAVASTAGAPAPSVGAVGSAQALVGTLPARADSLSQSVGLDRSSPESLKALKVTPPTPSPPESAVPSTLPMVPESFFRCLWTMIEPMAL